MKLRTDSIFYLLKEGIRNIFSNGTTSLASSVVLICCLVLMGLLTLTSNGINKAFNTVKSKNSIKIFLKSEISKEEEAKKIGDRIKEIPNIDSCEFYSKEEAMQKYDKSFGKIADGLRGDENPLPHAFYIKIKNLEKYDETVKILEEVEGVDSIDNRKEITEKLAGADSFMKIITFVLAIVFSALTLFVIYHTIRVTMYSRRLEISIMKSVGATDLFVRVPFIVEGVVIGFISALISIGILRIFSNIVSKIAFKMLPFTGVIFEDVDFSITVVFLLIGVLFGFVGGLLSIRKYLRKKGGEIIAA